MSVLINVWKFQENPPNHLRENWGGKNNNNNNKQYDYKKDFRLKRKTLIRNRVKPICSPTSFGEHNN